MNSDLVVTFEPPQEPADSAGSERGRGTLCRLAVERVLRRRGLLPPGVKCGAGRPQARYGSARSPRHGRKCRETAEADS